MSSSDVPEGDAAAPSKARWARANLELIAVVLLSVTAVCTSWTAFQSSKWSGEMAIAFNQAGAARAESVRNTNVAEAHEAADTTLFSEWLNDLVDNHPERARRHRARFRGELQEAADAWLKTKPISNPNAPASPLLMAAYQPPGELKAAALEKEADKKAATAQRANQQSDDYVMLSLLFALVLLFAGIATKVTAVRNRIGLIGMGTAGLVTGLALLLTFPVQL